MYVAIAKCRLDKVTIPPYISYLTQPTNPVFICKKMFNLVNI